jgi:hypothetical protein
MDMVEENSSSGGFSVEGSGMFGPLAGHTGLNVQAFAPDDDDALGRYKLAFFRFNTLKNFSSSEIEKGTGFGLGGIGVFASVGFTVNLAKAFRENTPQAWAGYASTLSAAWPAPFPAPSGASFFWSRDRDGFIFAGAELGWGLGVGGGFTRPYFKQIWFEYRADRGTIEALMKRSFYQATKTAKRADDVELLSWW